MKQGAPLRSHLQVAGLLVGLFALRCADPSASVHTEGSLGLVATQVPAGDAPARIADRLDLDSRYPTGSRILLHSADGERGRLRILSGDLAAAGAVDLSPQADAVLFAGRKTASSNWAIYEADLLGRGRPSLVIDTGSDCSDPAYLPGGRAVFTCANFGGGQAEALGETWSLYTALRDGSDLERISFGPGSAFDPTPLRDGRILFSMWQGPGFGRPSRGATALFTVNPDGTMLAAFSGSHLPPTLKFRARQTPDREVVFLAGENNGSPVQIYQLKMSRPQTTQHPLSVGVEPLAVEPLPGDELLVAGYATGGGEQDRESHVYRWSPRQSTARRVFGLAGWEEVEAIAWIPTPRPKDRPSAIDPNRKGARLLCYDSRRSDGTVGPPPDAPAPREILVTTLDQSSRGSLPTQLGRVMVESDGSFFVELPADLPLRVSTLDQNGGEIASSDWFWVRPGEVRSCFGCHESREAAPVNRLVQAISHAPLQPQREREAIAR